jgi:fatty acid CoA ligase FadD22
VTVSTALTNAAVMLADRARRNGWLHRPAYLVGDRVWRHGEVHDLAARAATALGRRGVGPGDRILLACPDDAGWIVAFLAAARLGAVVVPANPELAEGEHQALVRDAHPALVLGQPSLADRFDPDRFGTVPALLAEADRLRSAKAAPVGPDAWLHIQYTSGTTGAPKGAVHRHGDLAHHHHAVGETMLRLGQDDVSLSVSKLFFTYGFGNSLIYPLCSGSAAVLVPGRPTPAVVAELVARHRVTVLHAVPSAYATLLAEAADPAAFRTVRAAVSAGEVLTPELGARAADLLDAPVLDELGSTEVGGAFCANRLDDNALGTIGRPLPGFDLSLRDGAGRPAGDGEAEGELWVRGPTLLAGYFGKPEKTARVLVDGWLRTGDRAVRYADGRYRHHGRVDDLEMVGGITMSPVEVERLLAGHPRVREAAVAAVPDEHGATRLRAFVVATGGTADDALADELIGLVRGRLAPYKVPRSVQFVPALPRTPTGKLRRFVLRQPTQPGGINRDR